jgi:hypothetical protein
MTCLVYYRISLFSIGYRRGTGEWCGQSLGRLKHGDSGLHLAVNHSLRLMATHVDQNALIRDIVLIAASAIANKRHHFRIDSPSYKLLSCIFIHLTIHH